MKAQSRISWGCSVEAAPRSLPSHRAPAATDEQIIHDIFCCSSAGLVFAPRGLTYLRGHPEQTVRAHCVLLTKLGKLKMLARGNQNYFKISQSRALGDMDPHPMTDGPPLPEHRREFVPLAPSVPFTLEREPTPIHHRRTA